MMKIRSRAVAYFQRLIVDDSVLVGQKRRAWHAHAQLVHGCHGLQFCLSREMTHTQTLTHTHSIHSYNSQLVAGDVLLAVCVYAAEACLLLTAWRMVAVYVNYHRQMHRNAM